MERWDVAVIGGGVLGTAVACWLGARYEGRIVLVEREPQVARHASGRNTGVIHRPFYLHPKERKLFAKVAGLSYPMWKQYAAARNLPWAEVGTLKVAATEEQVKSLEKNVEYARANGMDPSELELLSPVKVSEIEPNVRCAGALLIKTDTVVDFRAFTESLRRDAEKSGVRFLMDQEVERVENRGDENLLFTRRKGDPIVARLTVNCAGGNAVDIAHIFGLAGEYADMHFRGEYWTVDERIAHIVTRNVYCVPRQGEFPFLDPHWIVRVDGKREIGPNAVPVPSPIAYKGLLRHGPTWLSDLFEPPTINKIRVWLNRDFVALSANEMWSSLARTEMLRRVQRFIPRLRIEHLVAQGTAGIRSVVMDRRGQLAKEAIEISGPGSFHVLNFNSPGATGAPAYAAHVVNKLAEQGCLDHVKLKSLSGEPWDWERAL